MPLSNGSYDCVLFDEAIDHRMKQMDRQLDRSEDTPPFVRLPAATPDRTSYNFEFGKIVQLECVIRIYELHVR